MHSELACDDKEEVRFPWMTMSLTMSNNELKCFGFQKEKKYLKSHYLEVFLEFKGLPQRTTHTHKTE